MAVSIWVVPACQWSPGDERVEDGTPRLGYNGIEMDKDQEERQVTRANKRALAQISEKNPELARLLKETIKTGTFLSYSPECRSRLLTGTHRLQRKRHMHGKEPHTTR
jgi:hypothetical protein